MTGFLVGLYIGVFVGIVGVCLFSISKGQPAEDEPTFRKQNRWRV